MAIAGGIAFVGMLMPYVVVPLRRAAGLPTYQWDADPATHPYISHFGDAYKPHDFSDPARLAAWSRHGEYRYAARLRALPADAPERDFPEARARLAARAREAGAAHY